LLGGALTHPLPTLPKGMNVCVAITSPKVTGGIIQISQIDHHKGDARKQREVIKFVS